MLKELYQERRAHLAELDKTRAELFDVINKADSQQLSTQDIHDQYSVVIDKLKVIYAYFDSNIRYFGITVFPFFYVSYYYYVGFL